MSLEAFWVEVRDWLEQNCPASMRRPAPDDEIVWGGRRAEFKNPDAKLWLERMAERGWTARAWPSEYGGGGLSCAQARVLTEEMTRIGARSPLFSFGIVRAALAALDEGSPDVALLASLAKAKANEVFFS